MYKDPLIEEARAATEQWLKMPPGERFDELVRRGIIDEQGRLLVHIPPVPWEERTDDRNGRRKQQ